MVLKVIGVGELLMDRFYKPNSTNYTSQPGGAPANVLAGLSKLGVKTGFITCLGQDGDGSRLLKLLYKYNIDTTNIQITNQMPTGVVNVQLLENGDHTFEFEKNSAYWHIESEKVQQSYLQNASFFLYGTVAMAKNPSAQSIVDLVRKAKKEKLTIVCDPNLREKLHTNEMIELYKHKALPLTDIVKVSENEAIKISNERNVEKALDYLLDIGPKTILMTLGGRGSRILTKNEDITIPSFKVNSKSFVGAGDAFFAGAIYGFLKNYSLEQIGKIANATGALVTRKEGAMNGLATIQEVKSLLNE